MSWQNRNAIQGISEGKWKVTAELRSTALTHQQEIEISLTHKSSDPNQVTHTLKIIFLSTSIPHSNTSHSNGNTYYIMTPNKNIHVNHIKTIHLLPFKYITLIKECIFWYICQRQMIYTISKGHWCPCLLPGSIYMNAN